MSYVEYQDRVLYSNGSDIGIVDKQGNYQTWGVDNPPAPKWELISSEQGFGAGSLRIACTALHSDGVESAPSPIIPVEYTENDIALRVMLPASSDVEAFCFYSTSVNGTELYHQGTYPNTGVTFEQSQFFDGRPLEYAHHDRMIAGQYLGTLNRRVLAAIGPRLYYSATGHLGITDTRYNWMSFGSDITFIGSVSDGVYIGTTSGTSFLSGADPDEFSITAVDSFGVVPQPAVQVFDGAFNRGDNPDLSGYACAWVTTSGEIIIGRAGGQIQRMSRERIDIPEYDHSSFNMIEENGEQRLHILLKNRVRDNLRAFDNAPIASINTYGVDEISPPV